MYLTKHCWAVHSCYWLELIFDLRGRQNLLRFQSKPYVPITFMGQLLGIMNTSTIGNKAIHHFSFGVYSSGLQLLWDFTGKRDGSIKVNSGIPLGIPQNLRHKRHLLANQVTIQSNPEIIKEPRAGATLCEVWIKLYINQNQM